MTSSSRHCVSKNARYVLGMAVALVVLSFLYSSMYVITDGTVGVVSTLGEYSDEEAKPGFHFKIPLIQTVIKMDTKWQTVTYKHGVSGMAETMFEDGIIHREIITVLDNKNLPIGIELTMQYRANGEQMSDILRTYGENYFEKAINPVVRDVVRDVAGAYEAETVAAQRGELGAAIRSRLDATFSQTPFLLGEVALRNIDLPPTVRQKIQQVQEAKQEEQRLAMVEKQAEVNKRIAIIEAERKAAELRIAADAEAYQITAVADARAKANRLVAASITPLLVQQNAIEKWDGKYPTTLMSGEGSGVLLQLPSGK